MVMVGQAVIVLIPYLNRLIKLISGQTGASLWFHWYFEALALLIIINYETITQAAVAVWRRSTTVTGASPQRQDISQ